MIDFLVIGGGIAGTSAAAALSALGQVTLLEGESALGYHASGRSAALYEANYGKPSTVALNRASLAYHQDADVLSPRGLLLVGSPDGADAFAADQSSMGLEPVTVAEAQAMIPILDANVIDRAAYDPHAWDIDTDKLLQGYASRTRAQGGTIVTKAQVTDIRREAGGWIVTAGSEDYNARQIVNAGLLVSPADEEPVEPHDAFADDMVLAEGFARYDAHVTEPVTRLLSSWAGLRTFAPDRTLVLGPDPRHDGFIWCAGQGGYGIQSSPAAGQLVADLVAGRPPQIAADAVAQLSPARFR